MLEKNKIFVTQPVLPPLEDYTELLKEIWKSRHLTNNGPFHQQFEQELADYLGVKYLSLFSNGTLALVMALQALRISGEDPVNWKADIGRLKSYGYVPSIDLNTGLKKYYEWVKDLNNN